MHPAWSRDITGSPRVTQTLLQKCIKNFCIWRRFWQKGCVRSETALCIYRPRHWGVEYFFSIKFYAVWPPQTDLCVKESRSLSCGRMTVPLVQEGAEESAQWWALMLVVGEASMAAKVHYWPEMQSGRLLCEILSVSQSHTPVWFSF